MFKLVFIPMLIFKKKTGQNSQGGGGGSLIFSSYVGSGPASTLHPKKISGISSNQKNIEILATRKNIPHSVPWP